MTITIIGAGNTATVLGKLFLQRGAAIHQIYSRNPDHTQELAAKMGAVAVGSLAELDTNADLYLIAVPDAAIAPVAAQMPRCRGWVVHTAGSVTATVLQGLSERYGVLYPLQSLNKAATAIPPIPFLVQGNSAAAQEELLQLAGNWSDLVWPADDAQRLHMHVAAVVMNNFTNHLFTLTQHFCTAHQLPFHLLIPLAQHTTARLTTGNPTVWQTGPARRNDQATIAQHLDLLATHPELEQLYRIFTNSIIQMYHKKDELR